MRKRDLSLDCIRILAILMIVLFHFSCLWKDNSSTLFVFHKNGTYGTLGTALFFMLSGYLLRKKYSEPGSLLTFYKKRWLSIFPSFYIAFVVAFIFTVIRTGTLFYQGKPYTLIFSLLGIDNLVQWYNIPSYALVGEWFTGVIIILYILFPLLNKLMKLNKWTVTVVWLIFYVLYVKFEWYYSVSEISVVTCGFIFWVGMLTAEYSDAIRKSYITGSVSLVVSVLLLFVITIPINNLFVNHIMAACIFISMLVLLKSLNGEGNAAGTVIFLSEISYCVYLTHHFIVTNLYAAVIKTGILSGTPFFMDCIIYLAIVMIASVVLYYATNGLLRLIKKKNH